MDGFLDRARSALEGSGLAPPHGGEACVVFLDAAPWHPLQAQALGLLDAGERARAERFRFDADRASYVLAHALWRAVLAVCLDRQPDEVPLGFLPSGQPCLAGTPLATSLSHSGPEVLVAVGAVPALGVDLERWPPRIPLDGLLPAICAPEEARALRALPPAPRERALLQLWTRKEALLKAFGSGLAQPPSSFCAIPGEPVTPPGQGGWPCRVVDLALPGDRVAALAMAPDAPRYRLHLPALPVDRRDPAVVVAGRP